MPRKMLRSNRPQASHPVATMKMCKRTKERLQDEIDRRSSRPTAYRNRCRSTADAARDLCQPREL